MKKILLFLIAGIGMPVLSIAQWATIPSTTLSTLYGCSFGDKSTLYAVGAEGVDTATLLKSTNGGSSFFNIGSGFLPATQIPRSCFFYSADTGVIAGGKISSGSAGSIYRTTDGGTTWSAVLTGAVSSFQYVTFADKKTGYACGGSYHTGIIYKTTDGGLTWSSIYSGGTSVSLSYISLVDGNTGYVTGMDVISGEAVWITIAGGVVATTTSVPDYREFSCAYFTAKDTGFVAANKMGSADTTFILRTTDGGVNWSRLYAVATLASTTRSVSFKFGSKTEGYTTGDASMMTTDGGKTWSAYTPVTVGTEQIFGMDIVGGTAVIVGEGGLVLKKTITSLSLPTASPTEFLVYPNPMRSEAQINFKEPLKDAACRIMDVTGKVVYSTACSGSKLVIERGSLQPGMYMIRVSSASTAMSARLLVQ